MYSFCYFTWDYSRVFLCAFLSLSEVVKSELENILGAVVDR